MIYVRDRVTKSNVVDSTRFKEYWIHRRHLKAAVETTLEPPTTRGFYSSEIHRSKPKPPLPRLAITTITSTTLNSLSEHLYRLLRRHGYICLDESSITSYEQYNRLVEELIVVARERGDAGRRATDFSKPVKDFQSTFLDFGASFEKLTRACFVIQAS
jgi:hypothetical protein